MCAEPLISQAPHQGSPPPNAVATSDIGAPGVADPRDTSQSRQPQCPSGVRPGRSCVALEAAPCPGSVAPHCAGSALCPSVARVRPTACQHHRDRNTNHPGPRRQVGGTPGGASSQPPQTHNNTVPSCGGVVGAWCAGLRTGQPCAGGTGCPDHSPCGGVWSETRTHHPTRVRGDHCHTAAVPALHTQEAGRQAEAGSSPLSL